MKTPSTKIWAHRGLSAKYPENTMIAFKEALEAGADGLEFDVHVTRDRKLVVIHDESLERTTNGVGLVHDHTLAELKKLDAGSRFSAAFRGERIPTLAEVLSYVATYSRNISLNIELKTDSLEYPGIESLVWDSVLHHGLEQRVIVSSFNHYSLRRLHRLHPTALIAPLYMERFVDPWLYAKHLNACAIHPYFGAISRNIVRLCHANGIQVHVFTVNSTKDAKTLMDMGVDAIMTDAPDVLVPFRDEYIKTTS